MSRFQEAVFDAIGLGTRIEQLAQRAGAVETLAKRAGISRAVVYNYIAGKSVPSLERALVLARAGGVSIEWLATGEEIGGKDATFAGGAVRKSAAAVNTGLLRVVLQGVEEGLALARRTMSPKKRAELVARLYEQYSDDPKRAEVGKVIALVRAAA